MGRSHTVSVHRILALTFLEPVKGKNFVNHIDGNKLNNKLSNLEFVTASENMQHAYRVGLIKIKSKRVVDTCTGQEFASCKDAALYTGIPFNTLHNYLNGGIKLNPTCLKYKEAA